MKNFAGKKLFWLIAGCLIAFSVLLIDQAPKPQIAEYKAPATAEHATNNFSQRQTASEKISSDLHERIGKLQGERVSVIVQLNDGNDAAIERLLENYGAREENNFENLGARAIEISVDQLEAFAARNEVGYVSLNRDSEWLGHIDTTTGTSAMRSQTGNNNFDGTGIGIAIIDSSVFDSHAAFLGTNGNKRVLIDKDFTVLGSSGNGDDYYGHGTHVAANSSEKI